MSFLEKMVSINSPKRLLMCDFYRKTFPKIILKIITVLPLHNNNNNFNDHFGHVYICIGQVNITIETKFS